MKTRCLYPLAILTLTMFIALSGCAPSSTAKKPTPKENDSSAPIEAEILEPGGDDSVGKIGPAPVADAVGEPEPEAVPDPLLDYSGDPEEDVGTLAMEFAAKLCYDTSKLHVIGQVELFRSPEIWIWSVDIDGEEGPVAKTYVRLDLNYVEVFDGFPEFAPKAVGPGEEEPNLTAKALDLKGLGYSPEPWLSRPGFMVYRKHVSINDWDVSVGNFIVRYIPETGVFTGINRMENEPADDIELNTDREAAIQAAAVFLNDESLSPTHVDLVQIQDGPSRFTDVHVYWEVKFDDGFVYVRCSDGTIAVSDAGISQPIGF
jgi:hypothetical protein